MAATVGTKLVFKLDNWNGGSAVLTDISAKLTSFDFPQVINEIKTTTYGANSEAHVVGLKSAKISLGGVWDGTIDAQMWSDYGSGVALLNFEYDPAGTGVGNPKYTGLCTLNSYKVNEPVNGIVTFSAELSVTGDVTRALN